jgi:hypothetical protein
MTLIHRLHVNPCDLHGCVADAQWEYVPNRLTAPRDGDQFWHQRQRPSSDRERRPRLATKPVINAISSSPNPPPPPFEPLLGAAAAAATTATDTCFCTDELAESLHVTVYMKLPTTLAVWLAVPDVAKLPDHGEPFAPPPLATHEELLADDQVRARV